MVSLNIIQLAILPFEYSKCRSKLDSENPFFIIYTHQGFQTNLYATRVHKRKLAMNMVIDGDVKLIMEVLYVYLYWTCYIDLPKLWSKWKTLKRKPKYGNRSMKTEIQKWEEKTRLSVAWLMNVPCRQTVTVSKRCESQVLIHRTPASTNTVV